MRRDASRAPRGERGRFEEQWTLGEMIQSAEAWRAKHGRSPRSEDWVLADGSHPAATTVQDRFGTWGEFLRAAQMPRECSNPYCTRRMYGDDDSECWYCARHRRTYGEQWAPQGLRRAVRRAQRRNEIVEAIRAFADEHGHPPTTRQWEEGGYKPTVAAAKHAFGSWKRAVERALD